MKGLGQEEIRAEKKKKGSAQFEGLVVSRMTREDRQELSDLLGIDPRQMQTPSSQTPFGLDPRKSLTEVTGDQVARSLANKSGKRPPEHQGLVLADNPVRPRPGSAEVKTYLDLRRNVPKGALQVLMVLRETTR
jgi:hypothetical protein